MKYRIFLTSFVIAIMGCDQVQKAADIIVHRSAREVYERDFKKNDSLLLKWKDAFERSQKDSLQITLPYSESGIFSKEDFFVYSYNVQLKEGERIVVEVEKQPDSAYVFIDLFQENKEKSKTFKLVESAEDKSSTLSREIDQSGFYKITVQPQMDLELPFILKIYSEPVYPFPISGGENKNIKSFWADPRDSGSRSHEGIDIFADRGTPVIAVTNGKISDVGNGGLGGKQVWLRDQSFNNTVYYAHLDSIAVSKGKRVKTGDTLGFVGNTGNAETLPPHLHFGIYKSKGAINPFPYIRKTEIQTVDSLSTITKAVVLKQKTEINKGPASIFKKVGSLKINDTLFVLGKSQNWFHIQTRDSLKGYVNEKLIKSIPSN
ncbi:MAG: M23 family metallopeptidase [Aequorivita sp.]